MSDAVAGIREHGRLKSMADDPRYGGARRYGVIHPRPDIIEQAVALLQSGSCVLFRGSPGTGKSSIARSLADDGATVREPDAELASIRVGFRDRPGHVVAELGRRKPDMPVRSIWDHE